MPARFSRATERGTTAQNPALAEFHALAGHDGPADGCQTCTAQQRRQRGSAAALRTHRRQTRQRVDAILAPVCAGCAQSPCACTDEAVDLILEADTLGLYSGGFDDSPEGWSA